MVTADEVLCLYAVVFTSKPISPCVVLVSLAAPIPNISGSRYICNNQRPEEFPMTLNLKGQKVKNEIQSQYMSRILQGTIVNTYNLVALKRLTSRNLS